MNKLKASWTSYAIGFLTVLFLCVGLSNKRLQWKMIIAHDASGYYHYLPAIFIYKDLKKIDYYKDIDNAYRPTGNHKRYALRTAEKTGNTVIKYTCGVAVFELPAFLIAHAWSSISDRDKANGYSKPYQMSIIFSSIFFVVIGLLLLGRFLKEYFSDIVSAVVIILIGMGTNLFYYTSYGPGMSHTYLFFLCCAILYLSQKWYLIDSKSISFFLGLCLGMVLLTRPTDVFIFFLPAFWWLQNPKNLWRKVIGRPRLIFISILGIALPCLLQMIYWKVMSGDWIYYSYQHERFIWDEPHIWEGLFSYRKGWFVYTPLALLGVLAAMSMLAVKKWRFYSLILLIYFVPSIIVVFSWSMWWYGGSFGCRVLIPSLALLAVPLAFLIDNLLKLQKKFIPVIAFTFLFFLASLNVFQSWQFRHGILHWDKMDKESYWYFMGKTEASQEERKKFYK